MAAFIKINIIFIKETVTYIYNTNTRVLEDEAVRNNSEVMLSRCAKHCN